MIGIQTQQVLVPKQVYIGDSAELLCTFNSGEQLFKNLTANGVAELSLENFTAPLNSKDYQIKKVSVMPTGVDFYQFTVTFVPWKTGEIVFPSYQIEDQTITFEPIHIVSLTEQNSITAIQRSTAPLLLPGTTYKLYGSIIFFILLLLALIRGLIHHQQVAFFIKNLQLKYKYRKNARNTKKHLLALANENSGLTEKEISSELQKIMRHYLEVRLSYPFTKTVTSDLMKGFNEATCGLLSEQKELAFEVFIAAFVRTDYIRFSQQVHFEPGELPELIQNLIANIVILETPAQPEKEEKTEPAEGGENV